MKTCQSSSMMFLKMDCSLCQIWECKDSRCLARRDVSFDLAKPRICSARFDLEEKNVVFDLESVSI